MSDNIFQFLFWHIATNVSDELLCNRRTRACLTLKYITYTTLYLLQENISKEGFTIRIKKEMHEDDEIAYYKIL